MRPRRSGPTTSRWPSRLGRRRRAGSSTRSSTGPICSGWRGPASESPPLVVQCHGGPDRGRGRRVRPDRPDVHDPGLRGGGGQLRAAAPATAATYRRALEGRWGEADVDDCVAVARWLAETGPGRRGADGHPRLERRRADRARCAGPVRAFAAAVSWYGVTDLMPASPRPPTTSSRATWTAWSARCPRRAAIYRAPLAAAPGRRHRPGRCCSSRARTTRSSRPSRPASMAAALAGPGGALRGHLLRGRVPRVPPGRDARRAPSRPSWPSYRRVGRPARRRSRGGRPSSGANSLVPWSHGRRCVARRAVVGRQGGQEPLAEGGRRQCEPGSPKRATRPSTALSALFALSPSRSAATSCTASGPTLADRPLRVRRGRLDRGRVGAAAGAPPARPASGAAEAAPPLVEPADPALPGRALRGDADPALPRGGLALRGQPGRPRPARGARGRAGRRIGPSTASDAVPRVA